MSKNIKVGLIGVGLMGHGMGHNILQGGFELRLFDPNKTKGMEELTGSGAMEMPSVRAVAENSDIVLCSLPTVPVIAEVIGGPDGVIESIGEGAIIVDTSTGTPVLATGFAERAAAKGAGFVDAALMKGPVQAMEGVLNVIAGGSDADVARVKPVLDTFSEQFFHVGPVGSGFTVKLLNQAIGLGTHAVVTEAFVLGAKLGVDIGVLFDIIDSGQASSEKLKILSKKFLDHDYSLKFATNTGIKDLRLCERMSVDAEGHTPILNTVIGLFETNAALGNGAEDVSTLAASVGKLTGIDFPEIAHKK
ncbi:MAG: NAD(P)-dependent oxidoreductase [Rhodospirillales bacterium]|nr:NAD(P)-dependent oxidoreductase [Rhodospirillales bacterium]